MSLIAIYWIGIVFAVAWGVVSRKPLRWWLSLGAAGIGFGAAVPAVENLLDLGVPATVSHFGPLQEPTQVTLADGSTVFVLPDGQVYRLNDPFMRPAQLPELGNTATKGDPPPKPDTAAQKEAKRQKDLRDAKIAQIQERPVTVRWTEELRWGEQSPVVMSIGSHDPVAAKQAFGEIKAMEHIEKAEVGIKVRAELVGAGVKVSPEGATTRDVTDLENVTIRWLVEPQRPGSTTLYLFVHNIVVTDDGETELEQPALFRTIKIHMGLLGWLSWIKGVVAGLEWLIGLLIACIGFYIVNRRKIRAVVKSKLKPNGKQPNRPPPSKAAS